MSTACGKEMRALSADEIGSVAGASVAEFNVLGAHFNFKDLGDVRVTWWDGRETWHLWNY